jgi:hypothetical protein
MIGATGRLGWFSGASGDRWRVRCLWWHPQNWAGGGRCGWGNVGGLLGHPQSWGRGQRKGHGGGGLCAVSFWFSGDGCPCSEWLGPWRVGKEGCGRDAGAMVTSNSVNGGVWPSTFALKTLLCRHQANELRLKPGMIPHPTRPIFTFAYIVNSSLTYQLSCHLCCCLEWKVPETAVLATFLQPPVPGGTH